MLRNVINEIRIDILKAMKGWRLLVVLIFLVACVAMNIWGEGTGSYMMMLFFILWASIALSPKIDKLHYLLPGESKNRAFHILMKSFVSLLLTILWYLFFIVISMLLAKTSFLLEMKQLFAQILPATITYISISMNSGYNFATAKNNPWMRENKTKYYLSLGLMIIPIYFACFDFDSRLHGIWFTALTMISYLCSFVIVWWQFNVCRHTDMSFENIKKVEKLF